MKSLIRKRRNIKLGMGQICAGCGAQWLGRGAWVTTGSTIISVAVMNGHHSDFLST